ncbi:MAG: hypothetical protein Q8R67_04405, partial [Rhodoferax sp.]|nr:hypothetical protein [Rhodoferax sp.]
VYQINAVMGDSSSGFLYLATSSGALSTGLTQSQLAAGRLNDQMALLNEVADKSRINIAGMGTALASVNTETFVSAIGLVFDNLATRIKGTIAGISSERIAVRQAALQIINPGVMSKASIQSGVAGVNTTLPGHVALDAANTALVLANSNLATVQASALSASAAASVAQTAKADAVTYYAGQNAQLRALGAAYSPAGTSIRFNATGDNNDAYNYNAATNSLNAFNSLGYSNYTNTLHQPWGDVSTTYSPDLAGMKADPRYAQLNAILSGGSAALATAASNIAKAQAVSAAAQAAITPATAEQTAAAGAAKKAALDYAAALQNFAIDASKSVTKLTSLREETVKYYEAQKQLADLMSTSAAGLRTTVADYRYAQKTPEQQVAELQGKFSSAYSLALAAQGDGATLSGYGDKINSLLGPLIDKLGETGKSNLVDSYLAQAESIAKLLEDTTPVNYQQDSLAMLGSIDQTLAALDASSQSAERIITAAINAGSDKTALGLHAVVAALTGQSIPAFEAGGHYLGGLALVGERGPELINFNQPGQIYNASQTRGMFAGGGQGGNTARLEALVERQAQQLEAITRELIALRREAAETSGNTSKMVKQADRLEVIGMPVRNASGAPLETVAAA